MERMKRMMGIIVSACFLCACQTKGDKALLVGEWHYQRMTTGNLLTRADSLAHALSELQYEGSTLIFYKNDSFELTNKDTASSFQGKGLFTIDDKTGTLLLERGIKNGVSDRMAVQVLELTQDSLKIGGPNEVMIYSRVKE